METEYDSNKFDQFINMVAELVVTYHMQKTQIVEKDVPNKSEEWGDIRFSQIVK